MLENTLSNHESSGIGFLGEASVSTDKLLPVERPVERWYAVSVRPRHEKSVARHLEHRGLKFFLPLYRCVRRWQDRRKELDVALFPGYVWPPLRRLFTSVWPLVARHRLLVRYLLVRCSAGSSHP